MKKRVLSFLMACFMVISTFIISTPIISVSAVEPTESWTLPMDWTTGLKSQNPNGALHSYDMGFNYAEKADGRWKFAFYTDVDAGVAYVTESTIAADQVTLNPAVSGKGKGPAPYIEAYNNRWIFAGVANYNKWYVCSTGRWQDPSIAMGDNSTYMKFTHYNASYTPAVVFVAPSAGTYSFSSLITGVTFTGTNGDPATLTATVRKNGTVLATFSPTSSNTSKTLTGEVELQAGEELAFVFSQDVNNFVAYGAADKTPVQFNLGTTVVTKIANAGSGSGNGGNSSSETVAVGTKWDLPTDFYTCNPGAGEKINGNWQLATYNTATKQIGYNFKAAGSSHNTSKWYFDSTDPVGGQCGTFSYTTARGLETNPGSDSYPEAASVIIYTAPDDGIYKFDVDTFSYGLNAGKNGSRTVIFYVMKDGVIYDITNPKYNLDNTENMTGEIALKKGEQVYFCAQRYTKYSKIGTDDYPAWIGARYEGLSVEKVAALPEGAEVVTKYTFAPDGTALANGQFEMMVYDFTTKTASTATLTTGADWYVSASTGNKLFWKTGTTDSVVGWGPDGSATNKDEGAAIVFTAPEDGIYNITGHFRKTYVKSADGKHYCDYKIILEDGTVVFDGTNYDESQLEAFDNLAHTLGGSVELAKDEKVYIVKSPNASAGVGAQGAELYSLTVAKLTVVESTHECHGGTATCTSPAICEECSQPYGGKDLTNHVSDCVATYTNNALKHTATMSKCGTVLPAESHNIVNGECTACGYEEVIIPGPWNLPMNWSVGTDVDENGWDLASFHGGLWRLTSFADLSDITTIRDAASSVTATEGLDPNANNSKTPQSYIETLNNRKKLVAGVTSYDRWYVNFGYRWQNKAFDYGDNATYIKVLPGCVNNGGAGAIDKNNNPTVVFTAPKTGKYNYTEFVKLVMDGATVEVTVRKNGVVLKSTTATTAGETISGEVELAKGDLLMFSFTLTSDTTVTDNTPVINLSNVTVSEVNASGNGGNTGNNPGTGSISVIVFIGVAVASAFTAKVFATKRRRNG